MKRIDYEKFNHRTSEGETVTVSKLKETQTRSTILIHASADCPQFADGDHVGARFDCPACNIKCYDKPAKTLVLGDAQ